MMADQRPAILSVQGLRTVFGAPSHEVAVVEDVSFELCQGEILGIVGESGSGKSMTALSMIRLVPPPGRIAAGEIRLEGESLLGKTETEMNALRGDKIAMIFQEPMTALNPIFTVGDQIMEALRIHRRMSRRQARAEAIELLRRVEIPMPAQRVDNYPHQLSGGMRQRVMIAMAIACRPRVLIADEPTTALDVTVQAQIFDLLHMLQREMDLAIVLITHDLGVIAQFAHRVLVMYAGRVVERAPVAELFRSPRHPYTRALIDSVPDHTRSTGRLRPIQGYVPSPSAMPPGCRFAPRCAHATEMCLMEVPTLSSLGEGVEVACFRHDGIGPVGR